MGGGTIKKLTGILGIIVLLCADLFAINADKKKAPNPERPNILFIITDQQYAEIMSHRMGRQYLHTPSIDRIAESGMLFTRAYTANPLCKPARTSIFSGSYPHETGAQTNESCKLDASLFPCMGTYLRDNGYSTGYVGKFIHSGNYPVHNQEIVKLDLSYCPKGIYFVTFRFNHEFVCRKIIVQ